VIAHGQLAGQTLAGRYEVLDLIGAGGMGEVYRARDRELDELVALKVIRDDLLAVPEVLERFRTEVKLARRVTHRSVARAYELVVTPDVTFYTMELIVGTSLMARLANRRRFAVTEAASIATALCDALGAAHAAGIVHRDVKPENVLLADDGRIVLTDFGIAAAAREGAGDLGGTPRYMAPEQAAGATPTPAADIFALGVVLYEMLTGAPGFTGGNAAEIAATKQRVDHLVIEGVDARLAELVARATAHDPAARLQTANAFRRLVAPFAGDRQLDRNSEASIQRAPALPTVIVRAPHAVDPASAHLIHGFHQAVVDRLVQWPRLRVVTRSSGDLAGSGLVEIAVTDDEVELTATSRPQSLVLRLPFDADSLQRSAEQAARIVATLMGSDAAAPPVRGRALPAEALELILRARHEARRDRSKLGDTIRWCERALELAPGHPRVEATLATCQAQLAFYGAQPGANLLDAAEAHALDALAADPDAADAHFARAQVELHRGRPVTAAVCFRAAIAHEPLMAEAHEWLGRMLLEAGFRVDALARFDEAAALAPIEAVGWGLGIAAALEGRWDEVDRMIEQLRGIGVDGGRPYRLRLASWRGRLDAERDTYDELAAMTSKRTFERELVLALYDPVRPWTARRDQIVAMVVDSTLASARRRAFLGQIGAEGAGAAHDVDTCIKLLLHCNTYGLFDLPWLDRCPLLASVRGEPRFAIIRADVAARAEAILDALYGEHRDQATVATAMASR
jgi:serine/threonine-protein kinase